MWGTVKYAALIIEERVGTMLTGRNALLEKKESWLKIRVSEQDLKQYAATAEKMGLSMAAWVRSTLKRAIDASKERKQRAKKVSGG
jgi:predicted DNA binding CopG/RHH family protein